MSTPQALNSDASDTRMQLPIRIGPRLSPEITDYIIDYLHDSPTDLRTCACVCKAWLASSRFHLFYSILIDPHDYSRCRGQYKTIQRSPDIALYVRELSYSCFRPSTKPPRDIVPDLLRSFTALRKLEMIGFSPTAEYLTRILPTLAAPNLRQISLDIGCFCDASHIKWSDWMGVDHNLNSDKFGSLRSVKILLIPDCARTGSRIRRKFIDHLPSLVSRGLLEVRIPDFGTMEYETDGGSSPDSEYASE